MYIYDGEFAILHRNKKHNKNLFHKYRCRISSSSKNTHIKNEKDENDT